MSTTSDPNHHRGCLLSRRGSEGRRRGSTRLPPSLIRQANSDLQRCRTRTNPASARFQVQIQIQFRALLPLALLPLASGSGDVEDLSSSSDDDVSDDDDNDEFPTTHEPTIPAHTKPVSSISRRERHSVRTVSRLPVEPVRLPRHVHVVPGSSSP